MAAFKPAISFQNTVSKHERRCMRERRLPGYTTPTRGNACARAKWPPPQPTHSQHAPAAAAAPRAARAVAAAAPPSAQATRAARAPAASAPAAAASHKCGGSHLRNPPQVGGRGAGCGRGGGAGRGPATAPATDPTRPAARNCWPRAVRGGGVGVGQPAEQRTSPGHR